MKELVQFINEAANTTAIVNKIKKEFQKEFGDKVILGSARANHQQLYDVYICDLDINTLKKVNDILKNTSQSGKDSLMKRCRKSLMTRRNSLTSIRMTNL